MVVGEVYDYREGILREGLCLRIVLYIGYGDWK